MTEEIWKPVPGFEGAYEVSDHGRVKSVARDVPHAINGTYRVKERISAGYESATGKYRMVDLWRGNVRHREYVHRLVLRAFLGPAPDKADGCHNDGNRQNNRLENLRWDSRSGNFSDMLAHGTRRRGAAAPQAKLTEATVRAIRSEDGSQKEIARAYGVSQASVSMIRSGRNWGWLK